jgi:hypothetical protein
VLLFLCYSSKTILDKAARLRHAPTKLFRTKPEAIIHVLAGTVLGGLVHLHGQIDRQEMFRTWQNTQERSFARNSEWINDQNYDAMFNPFPEGVDQVVPNTCLSYWIKIPEVDITLNNVHVMSFLFSCRHVSTPGSAGQVSEHVFTAHGTMSNFCQFQQRMRHQLTLYDFLESFHEEYLHQATVTEHVFRGNRDLSNEDRQQLISDQLDAVISLLEFVQEDNNNANVIPLRTSLSMVLGALSIAILKVVELHPVTFQQVITFHVIIPRQRTYFIGASRLLASTRTKISGVDALKRFLLRIFESQYITQNFSQFICWIYRQSMAAAAAAAPNNPSSSSGEEDDTDDENTDSSATLTDTSFDGVSIQELANANWPVYGEEDTDDATFLQDERNDSSRSNHDSGGSGNNNEDSDTDGDHDDGPEGGDQADNNVGDSTHNQTITNSRAEEMGTSITALAAYNQQQQFQQLPSPANIAQRATTQPSRRPNERITNNSFQTHTASRNNTGRQCSSSRNTNGTARPRAASRTNTNVQTTNQLHVSRAPNTNSRNNSTRTTNQQENITRRPTTTTNSGRISSAVNQNNQNIARMNPPPPNIFQSSSSESSDDSTDQLLERTRKRLRQPMAQPTQATIQASDDGAITTETESDDEPRRPRGESEWARQLREASQDPSDDDNFYQNKMGKYVKARLVLLVNHPFLNRMKKALLHQKHQHHTSCLLIMKERQHWVMYLLWDILLICHWLYLMMRKEKKSRKKKRKSSHFIMRTVVYVLR